jgi:S1-C subfamily serine protease
MSKPTSSTPTQNLSAALADLVASVAPSVVAIHSSHSRSSGFVWRPGLIVTADETLSEEDEFIVTPSGGDTVAAHLVGRDPTTDIALLRVESDLQPFSLTESPMVAHSLWRSALRRMHRLLPLAWCPVPADPGGLCGGRY